MKNKKAIIIGVLALCAMVCFITEVRYRISNSYFYENYEQVTAKLSQRTDFTDPSSDGSAVEQREYLFRYIYNGEEHIGKVLLTEPDSFPLAVGDVTEVFVNKQKPTEIYYPKKTPIAALLNRLRNIKNINNRTYR